MLKLLAIIARVYDDLPFVVTDLSVTANVCKFTHTELDTFQITLTLSNDGKLTEQCNDAIRTFDSLDAYDTYLTALMAQ